MSSRRKHGASPSESLARVEATIIPRPDVPPTVAGAAASETTTGEAVEPPKGDGLPSRYEDRGLIDRGGMGEVRRVYDRVLERIVAMKLMLARSPGAFALFAHEARLSAQLQHPAVVAVHDFGSLADGRLWFTMRLVEGKTFDALIHEVHAASGPNGWGPTDDGWTLHRLVLVVEQVCQAVAFAHTREAQVLHRDLKPGNIMVGRFGEVQVLDWGIARIRSRTESGGPKGSGTPGYRAPEQAAGATAEEGTWTDVWALGAVLYTVLTNEPPSGSLVAMVGGTASYVPRIRTRPEPPEDLVALVGACMQPAAADRPRDATVVAERIRAWIDGTERRERAKAHVAAAARMHADARMHREHAHRLREDAGLALALVHPWSPTADKRRGWDLEDAAVLAERQAEAAEAEQAQCLRRALEAAPDYAEARSRLADHFEAQLDEAERRQDGVGIAERTVLLRSTDPGRYEAWRTREAELFLETNPRGADAELWTWHEEGRRLVLRPTRALGATPLRGVRIPAGSHVVKLKRSGYAPVTYPILVGRGERWDGVPPGEVLPSAVRLQREDSVGADDVYVPGGWFWSGGDADAPDGLPRRRVWVDSFLIKRFPVTVGEYLAYLNDLLDEGQVEEAMRRAPRRPQTGELSPIGLERGRFLLGRTEGGTDWQLDWPVIHVDQMSALAYGAWLGARSGRPWRLPHDQEWEKAARGVDGRVFPWGSFFDPTWANCSASRPTAPTWVSVRAFPEDESPYGVRGMAGNVREWCLNEYRRDGGVQDGGRVTGVVATTEPLRMMRGGNWAGGEGHLRCAGRFVAPPEHRMNMVGFRLATPASAG